MGWVSSLRVSMVAISLFISASVAAQEDFGTQKVEETLVKIRSLVNEMNWIDGSAGRGKIEVFRRSHTTYFQHQRASLEEVADGREAWILARHQERQSGYESGQSIPPMMIQVQAMVVGSFDPPPLTEKQKEAKVKWHSGKLSKSGNKNFTLGGVLMQAGANRPVLNIEPKKFDQLIEGGKKAPLRKGALIQVKGVALPVDQLNPEKRPEKARKKIDTALAATQIHVIDPRFPKKENEIILGRAK